MEMTTKEALIGFYKFNRLNLTDDFKAHCVRVYRLFVDTCTEYSSDVVMLVEGKTLLVLEAIKIRFLATKVLPCKKAIAADMLY